jgi:membrane protein DedA with SNARE-associated domain
MTEVLMKYATHWIDVGGYPSVAGLMMLESMVAPVPSEAVMPFAGYLIAEQRFSWLGVACWSTFGSIIGSWISYAMGYYGGKPFVRRFGKYVLLNLHDLDITENFFRRYGNITIFVGRFIPVIRHLISIPAGAGRMNLVKFSIYTVVGACMWNMFLAGCGYHLRKHWDLVEKFSKPIDVVMVVLFAVALFFFVKHHLLPRLKQQSSDGSPAS